jgi:hypothetical protein
MTLPMICAGVVVLGQPIHRTALLSWCAQLRVDGQHMAGLVQAIDRFPVLLALGAPNAETAEAAAGRAVIGEPDARGVRGVKEQLLRRIGEHLVRRRNVQRNVPLSGLFMEQVGSELFRVGVGVADQDAAPATMQGYGRLRFRLAIFRESLLQALVGRCLAA